MKVINPQEIVAKLELVARELEEQLPAETPPYSPEHEVQYATQVDHYCSLMTLGPGPGRQVKFPKLTPVLTMLVICRLRDAQRHIRASSSAYLVGNRPPSAIYRDLLVEGWHSYAESYHLERRRDQLPGPCSTSHLS